jgi:uncharacterized repeat protein (TIGR03803 family)
LPTDHAARAEHGLQLSLEHDRKAVVIAGVETILHSFTNQGDGVYPSGLVQGTDGNFYGTAGGGMNGNGTIFKLTPRVSLLRFTLFRLSRVTTLRVP